MPANKKAQTRYQVYDRCLRNPGRRYTWKDLVDEVNNVLEEQGMSGIGKTQFYKDIKDMTYSVWAAPIEVVKEGRTAYYRYSEKDYSINNHLLNETEINQLKSALSVLSRFKGMPQFEWINEMIPVIESKMGLVPKGKEVISFDANVDYKGLNHITILFNAIINKRVLKISYHPFTETKPIHYSLHPYHLRQYNNRWFVFGYNSELNNPCWILALDRILDIQEINEEFKEDTTNWEDFFFDIVGVTHYNEDCIDVRLLFTPEQAPYIETKPIHPTQKHKRTENGELEVTINVIPNYELEVLILSFGEKVQVLGPLSLREKIYNRIKQSFEKYQIKPIPKHMSKSES